MLAILINESKKAKYIQLDYEPSNGLLIKNHTELLITCSDGNFYKYSLSDPTSPTLINSKKLCIKNSSYL